MHYHEFDPTPALAAWVASYWEMTVADDMLAGFPHRIIPDGCIALAFGVRVANFASLVGPRIEPFDVPVYPGARYVGVRFWPDAGGRALGFEAPDLRGVVEPAEQRLGGWVLALHEDLRETESAAEAAAIFDRHLAGRLAVISAPDPVARAAVLALVASRGELPIGGMAAGLGLSMRTLQRHFLANTGLTPKEFARIRRLRSVLFKLLGPAPRSWSAVAHELGFSDHAHLVREFRDLAGASPTAVARGVARIAHGRVRP